MNKRWLSLIGLTLMAATLAACNPPAAQKTPPPAESAAQAPAERAAAEPSEKKILAVAETEQAAAEPSEKTAAEAAAIDLYASIPDKKFPIPMRNGTVIPYDRFSPPEDGEITTSYIFGTSFMESYKEQLRNEGFVDEGSADWIESLWKYERAEDEATLMVEMFHDEGKLVINMYVNYLSH